MKSLITRAVTGAVYVAVIVCSLLLGEPWGFPALCVLLAIPAQLEFYRLCGRSGDMWPVTLWDVACGLLVTGSVLWAACSGEMPSLPAYMAPGVGLWFVVRMILQLYRHTGDPLNSIAESVMGVVYCAAPLACAAYFTALTSGKMMLAVFIVIWLSDTGAYCVGSLLGRHALFKRISPKKSWEGFWGGLIFAAAGGGLCSLMLHTPLWWTVAASVVISVLSVWGDLCESLLKRSRGVKDSGNLLPGHGGVLDRLDSLLLTAPVLLWLLLAAM